MNKYQNQREELAAAEKYKWNELTESQLAELPEEEREHAMHKYQQRREEMMALLEEGKAGDEALLQKPDGSDPRTQKKDKEAAEGKAADEALLQKPDGSDPRTQKDKEAAKGKAADDSLLQKP